MSINRVILTGNTTKDIEMKATSAGVTFVSFTLAVNAINDKADFIDCVAFGQPAKFLSDYVKKGYKLAVEGRITSRTYDRKDGTKAKSTEVVCDRVEIIVGKAPEGSTKLVEQQNDDSDVIAYNDDDLPF